MEQKELYLFMLLVGGKPDGRHTEQHDVLFGIGSTLSDLLPKIKAFWPGVKLHIDAWREVTSVEGYRIHIQRRAPDAMTPSAVDRLFFINLGGYQQNKFEEQHYFVLTVQADKTAAISASKKTEFFRKNHIPGASSHIDDKYGIDVDDLFQIEELLSEDEKDLYQIQFIPEENVPPDPFHLGYTKLSML